MGVKERHTTNGGKVNNMTPYEKINYALILLQEATSEKEYFDVVGFQTEFDNRLTETINELYDLVKRYENLDFYF